MTAQLEIRSQLAPYGRIRAAVNLGNPVLAQSHPSTRQLTGLSVDLARDLGRRVGAPVELVVFDAARKVVEALKAASWDVAFLAVDSAREAEIGFTPPYLSIEGTYMVREDSPLRALSDFDRPGIRIAVGRGAAYELFLRRSLRSAELITADSSNEAIEMFMTNKLDAVAGVRQTLLAFSNRRPGLRVITEWFTAIRQAIGIPKQDPVVIKYLAGFLEELKSNGFLSSSLARSGQDPASILMS